MTRPDFTPDFSPSAEQNKQPILARLLQLLPPQGAALEIASGTGQHVAWFASNLPGWSWQPTEAQVASLGNIHAHVEQAKLSNVLPAAALDVLADTWLTTDAARRQFDLIFCANMLHIAPWQTCAALMRGSARHLTPGGRLVTYGPYFESDIVTAPSNLAFDQSLRQRDVAWGVRQLDDVAQQARLAGLALAERHVMPANNLLLVWARG